MSQPIISQLFVYPLKSAQGIELQQLPILSSGPQFDREWMIAKENGSFVSQRTHPQLSQFKTALTKQSLEVTAPNQERLSIPFSERSSELVEVGLFGKPTMAEKVSARADEWWCDQLKDQVQLVRSPQKPSRFTSGNHGPVTEVRFADGYPLLLTNQATLEKLNERLNQPVSMDRFRPNIVVNNVAADLEDSWSAFEIADVPFLSVKACTRCSIINVNQQSGQSSKEVTQALKSYRTKEGQVIFGMNLSHQGEGLIKVGDPLLKIQ